MEFDKKLYKELKENICKKYGTRYDDVEKIEFRKYIKKFADNYKVDYCDDKRYSDDKNTNIVLGNINDAKVLLCAHYDTAATVRWKRLWSFITRNYKFYIESNSRKLVPIGLFSIFYIALLIHLGHQTKITELLICLIIGYFMCIKKKANPNNYNDNSSGIITVLSLIDMNNICVVLFDNEEKGMLGSKAFRVKQGNLLKNKLIINIDSVGNSDFLIVAKTTSVFDIDELIKKEFLLNLRMINNFLPGDGEIFKEDFDAIAISGANEENGVLFIENIHSKKDTIIHYQTISLLSNFILSIANKYINQ